VINGLIAFDQGGSIYVFAIPWLSKQMLPKLSFLISLVLLAPLLAMADDPPKHVRVSDLSKTPMSAGPLTISLVKFSGSPRLGNARIELRVENTSTGFATFSPHRLSFVGEDNAQVDIWGTWIGESNLLAPRDKRIVPGAHIRENHYLDGKVSLPARLYYDDKLLAVITE
jgi:hypothetical protein